MSIILKAENISKQYRLGNVGTGTLKDDLKRSWYALRGKDDPFLKIGAVNDRSLKSSQDYVWALQDINFEVNKGEVLGIIGRNGAGKSTLLKILSRVTAPTTGIIKSGGRLASLLEVGTGFHPELTGRENIYLNGAILGMTKFEISSKLDEIIDFSGCELYIDTPTKRYSSGMRVRLAFAVAAHLEPEILVVDEVLAVGDAEFQKKAIGKMQDISSGEGRTVLFVSHNMASIKSLCTRGIVLDNGFKCFDGNEEDAVAMYYSLGAATTEETNITEKPRADKELGQQLRITDILINSDSSNVNGILETGRQAFFAVNLKNLSEVKFKNISVTISVFHSSGNFLFSMRSDSIGKLYNINEDSKTIVGRVDKLPLNKGEYYINVNCSSNNVMLDSVHEACKFEVLLGDFYGTGKLPAARRNGVFIDYDFDV